MPTWAQFASPLDTDLLQYAYYRKHYRISDMTVSIRFAWIRWLICFVPRGPGLFH